MRQIHRLLSSLLLACISAPSSAEALQHLIQQDRRHGPIVVGTPDPRPEENSQLPGGEDGTFQNGGGVMSRRWNGDQVDHGLNFANPTLFKVRLGTYR